MAFQMPVLSSNNAEQTQVNQLGHKIINIGRLHIEQLELIRLIQINSNLGLLLTNPLFYSGDEYSIVIKMKSKCQKKYLFGDQPSIILLIAYSNFDSIITNYKSNSTQKYKINSLQKYKAKQKKNLIKYSFSKNIPKAMAITTQKIPELSFIQFSINSFELQSLDNIFLWSWLIFRQEKFRRWKFKINIKSLNTFHKKYQFHGSFSTLSSISASVESFEATFSEKTGMENVFLPSLLKTFLRSPIKIRYFLPPLWTRMKPAQPVLVILLDPALSLKFFIPNQQQYKNTIVQSKSKDELAEYYRQWSH